MVEETSAWTGFDVFDGQSDIMPSGLGKEQVDKSFRLVPFGFEAMLAMIQRDMENNAITSKPGYKLDSVGV